MTGSPMVRTINSAKSWMPAILLIAGGAVVFGLIGCQDSARRPITYHPLQNPVPVPVAAPPPVLLGALPIIDHHRGQRLSLGVPAPYDAARAATPVAVAVAAVVPQATNTIQHDE